MSRKTTPPPQAETPVERAPAFRPFEWVNQGAGKLPSAERVLDALGQIRDLTCGTRVLMQMLEQDDLAQWCDDVPPLIGETNRGELLRLAITASRIASEAADEVLDWARENGTKGGAA